MSDAQSILLFLLIFYGLECLKWTPLWATSILSPVGFGRFWSRQSPIISLYGGGKSVYLAPIIPGFRFQLISLMLGEEGHQGSQLKSADAVRGQVIQLRKDTLWLRGCSLAVFITYFVYLPVIYNVYGEGSFLYGGVGIGYLFQAMTGLSYRSLHTRYFPSQRGVRVLHSFYCFVLPWHSMRAADEFFIKRSHGWSELAVLAAFVDSPRLRARLERYFREAYLMETALYCEETVDSVVRSVGLDPSVILAKPALDSGTKYCPCCHVVYEGGVISCIDCQSVDLVTA